MEGSFIQVPKTFIMDQQEMESHSSEKVSSFLPKFLIEVNGREVYNNKEGIFLPKSTI